MVLGESTESAAAHQVVGEETSGRSGASGAVLAASYSENQTKKPMLWWLRRTGIMLTAALIFRIVFSLQSILPCFQGNAHEACYKWFDPGGVSCDVGTSVKEKSQDTANISPLAPPGTAAALREDRR